MATRWLPPGAALPALERAMGELAADWGRTWFGFALAGEGGLRGDPVPAGDTLFVHGDDVAIGLSGDGLGELALGVRRADRGAADRALLDRVGDAVRDDLQRRVAALVDVVGADWAGPVDRLAWQPVRWGRFGGEGGRLSLSLYLGDRCFAAAVYARSPAAPPSAPLTPLSEAVAAREVGLSARLGRCTLQLAEMREMTVGNVLLFDAAIDAALPVVVEDAATGIATARVVREATCWTLALETGAA